MPHTAQSRTAQQSDEQASVCLIQGMEGIASVILLDGTHSMVQMRTMEEKRGVSMCLPTAPPVDIEATIWMFSSPTHSRLSS